MFYVCIGRRLQIRESFPQAQHTVLPYPDFRTVLSLWFHDDIWQLAKQLAALQDSKHYVTFGGKNLPAYPAGRRGMRFPVDARVIYKWVDATGTRREGEGRTINISEWGVYIRSQNHPPQGTPLQLKIFLSPVPITLPSLPIVMDARVVRIEKGNLDPALRGFAVEGRAVDVR